MMGPVMPRRFHVFSAWVRRSLILVLALVVSRAYAADDAAGLPRYKLPLGRNLTYTITSESRPTDPAAGGSGATSSTGTWRLSVVRENPDGSRRIIVRSQTSFTQVVEGKKFVTPP